MNDGNGSVNEPSKSGGEEDAGDAACAEENRQGGEGGEEGRGEADVDLGPGVLGRI